MKHDESRGAALLTEAEREAVEALDRTGLVAFLRELVAVPSVTGDEDAAQRRVAAWMRAEGLTVDAWEIDLATLACHPDYSAEVERSAALGVVGVAGASGRGRDLLFDGHIDVVPVGDRAAWSVDPWAGVLRDGRVYGRGACDMKGGLCAALYAVKALRDAGVPLLGRVLVASVAGEEEGGLGTLATLLRGHRADGAVVTEPTGLRLVTAAAGSLMFRLTVRGRAAHGSVRLEGISAVEKFLPLFAALRRLETERNAAGGGDLFAAQRLPWPLEIGTVRAGEWASSVPERLVCEGRYGFAPGEDEGAAKQAFEVAVTEAAAADAWLRAHPPLVEWWGGRFAPALTDPGDPLVTALAGAAAAVLGVPVRPEGVSYGSDMRLLVNVGRIPTAIFGPGDVRDSHRGDESVAVADVEAAAATLIVTALRFCGC